MPFKSEKQRKWMWANDPEMAQEWQDEEDKKHEGMQVKIKYMPSKNKFVVKTRLHPDFEVKKEEKKRGKNRKRNKKNSGGGMFDPTTSI